MKKKKMPIPGGFKVVAKKAKKKKTPRHLEKAIQKDILLWLDSEGFLHWRQNSGYAFVADRMIKLGAAGLPDIIVVLGPNGKAVGLEVKVPGGKLRESQVVFAQRMINAGGEYVVVHSLEEAKGAVNQILANQYKSAYT